MSPIAPAASRAAALVAVVASCSLLLAGCGSPQKRISVQVPSAASASPTSTVKVLPPVEPGKSSGSLKRVISVAGALRSYRLHVPLTAPSGPRPLVVVLHGATSSPTALEYAVGLDSVADRLGFFVAYPEGLSGYWNTGRTKDRTRTGNADDPAFVAALVADVIKRNAVDAQRTFVAGVGDGGLMASVVVARRPALFKGLVMLSSQLVDSADVPRPRSAIPTVVIHGTQDPVWPWAGNPDPEVGTITSVPQTLGFFAGLDRAKATPARPMPDRDPADGTTATQQQWLDAAGKPAVALYTVTGGGAPWPGSAIDTRSQVRTGRTSRDVDASSIVGHFAIETR